MSFLLSLILFIITAILICASLKIPTRVGFLIGLFVTAYANMLLIAQITGIIGLLSNKAIWISLNGLSVALAGWFWQHSGRPHLIGAFAKVQINAHPIRALLEKLISHPALIALIIGLVILHGMGVFSILTITQNNYDSMTYHLGRIGYWKQFSSILPWRETDYRHITMPINAEMGLFWILHFSGNEHLVGFVQWVAMVVTMFTIFGLARLLGYRQVPSLFAALIFATFTEVYLQSISTQNDLLTSTFLIASIYFLYVGFKREHARCLLLSGAAMGMTLGTKVTILFLIPGLILFALFGWWMVGRKKYQFTNVWIAACLLGIVLLGSYHFIINMISYQNPLGPSNIVAHVSGIKGSSLGFILRYMQAALVNMPRYLYQILDFASLPLYLAEPLTTLKVNIARPLLVDTGLLVEGEYLVAKGLPFYVDMPLKIHEDLSWFGPLAFFLILPGTVIAFLRGLKQKDFYSIGLIIIGMSFLAGRATQHWTPYDARYFTIMFSILAPFMAMWFVSNRLMARAIRWAMVGIGLLTLAQTVLHNESRPIINVPPLWEMSRIEQMTFFNRHKYVLLDMIETHVPSNGKLGAALRFNEWNYPLFGKKLERYVLPIKPVNQGYNEDFEGISPLIIDRETASQIDHLLVDKTLYKLVDDAENWLNIGSTHFVYLYYNTRGKKFEDLPIDVKEKLLSNNIESFGVPLLETSPMLKDKIGATLLQIPSWGIEVYKNNALIWLGHGAEQGLGLVFWSDEEHRVTLIFDVMLGRIPSDATLIVETQIGEQVEQWPIKGNQLRIPINLQTGSNHFFIRVMNAPDPLPSKSNDKRPLLLMLDHITVID